MPAMADAIGAPLPSPPDIFRATFASRSHSGGPQPRLFCRARTPSDDPRFLVTPNVLSFHRSRHFAEGKCLHRPENLIPKGETFGHSLAPPRFPLAVFFLRPLAHSFARYGRHNMPPDPLGPLGFECSQHRQTLRPSVDGIRSKALRPFGVQ